MILNQLKTIFLLGILSALLIGIGAFFGTSGIIIAFVFAILMNVGSYFFSDKIVLKMYKAMEAKRKDYEHLHRVIENLSRKAKIPKPKVYIVSSEQANAFATGRNPKHSAVAFTTGILSQLTEKELEAVAAHELAHIKNRDTLVATIAATIAAVIAFVAEMQLWGALFGGRDGQQNIVQLLGLIILAPLTATVIQMAISRSREYMADATAAKLMGTPQYMISALEKIHHIAKHTHLTQAEHHKNSAALMIVNPFFGHNPLQLFSTHPTLEKRVASLKKLR